jgi:RHS repeat-associated protein
VASAATKSVPGTALESPAVREAIKRESVQEPGPLTATQGTSGGTGEPGAPAGGELQSSESTAFSDTWLVRKRHHVTRIYAAPVNYKGSDGRWHRIDNALVPAALGGYENQANSFTLTVPSSLSSGLSLSRDGQTVSVALQGGKEAMPSVSGQHARYSEALTATDFEYESTSTGVKETATLKDASAPNALRFSLSLPGGLTPKAIGGGVEIRDGQGHVLFTIPAPVAFRPGADPSTGRALPISVAASGSGWLLTVDTSAPWLRSELSTGAVAVDPSLEVGGSQNCWVESDSPSSSYCSQTTMDVGYQSTETAHEHHGLLEFNLSSLPEGAEILNAKLGLYLQSHSTSNTKPVGVYRVTKPWTNSATWEKYDGTHTWSTAGGDYSAGEDAVVNPSVGTATGWDYWYPTKMVQEWANGSSEAEGGAPNDGLIVKDETDNSINNVLTFASIRATEHTPFLEVAYEPLGIGRQPQWTILNHPITDKINAAVNVASGNLILENQDLQIKGRGPGYASVRRYNSLDPNIKDYGRFNDNNDRYAGEFSDGSFEYTDETDADFIFIKKPDGTFITPPGIKATVCTAGHAPCPSTLPSEVAHRLIFNSDQSFIDFYSWGGVRQKGDRHGNDLSSGFTSGIGNATSWTDTQGRKINYKTNSAEMYTEIKDEAGGRTLTYEYEGTGGGAPLIGYKDAAGNTTKYHYEYGDLNKVTTPGGNVTRLIYNSKHQIEYINPTTNSEHSAGPATKFTYYAVGAEHNPCGTSLKATVVTDPDGVAEREKGAPETEKSHTTTYCSNVHDEVVKTFNANGLESKATFDPTGNQISSTAAARETGATAGVTSRVYGMGGANLTCEVQSAEPTTSCPTGATEKGYSTRYGYHDATFAFQPTESVSARQKTTKACYWEGSEACTAEGSGAPGELKQQALPVSGEPKLSYTYNSQGLPTSSTDADGHKTSYEYDSSGNLKTIIPPTGAGLGKATITVDALSRPHTVTQCLVESGGTCTSSQTATLSYDPLDRVSEAVDTGPGATKTFKYTYDADGNLAKREDPTGTTTFKHDPLNRITEESLPGSLSNAYTYDEASNLQSFTDAGGTTEYKYDRLNELEALSEPGGNCGTTPSKCTRFEYDGDGSLTKLTYPSKATLNYTVDQTTGRPTGITAKNASGETVLSHAYSYLSGTNDTPLIFKDSLNLPGTGTSETVYEYDPLDRLLEATSKSSAAALKSHYQYVLDPAGNRSKQEVSTTAETGGTPTYFLYNTGNELECRMKSEAACSKNSTSEISGYSYDGAGNQTGITGYNDPASTSFSYNNLNQLKALTPPGASEQTATYLGSGQSNLTGLGTISLQNSALGLTRQTNEAGTSSYARTPAGLLVDERLPGGTSYNPIIDATGDVIGLLSSTGALAQAVRYGPFGENTKAEGSVSYTATNDPFLYQGGYHTAGGNAGNGNVPNGLYHFGERYYDPTTGRWTQRDPAGDGGYEFDGSDPINRVDPSGEFFIEKFIESAYHTSEHFIFSDSLKTVSKFGRLGLKVLHGSTLITAGKFLYHCVRQDETGCDPIGNYLGIEKAE